MNDVLYPIKYEGKIFDWKNVQWAKCQFLMNEVWMSLPVMNGPIYSCYKVVGVLPPRCDVAGGRKWEAGGGRLILRQMVVEFTTNVWRQTEFAANKVLVKSNWIRLGYKCNQPVSLHRQLEMEKMLVFHGRSFQRRKRSRSRTYTLAHWHTRTHAHIHTHTHTLTHSRCFY